MDDTTKSKSSGFGKRGGPGAKHPNIVIKKVIRREPIDYEKLAGALIEIARIQVVEEKHKSNPAASGNGKDTEDSK